MSNRIDRFLKLMKDRGASDLHLTTGRPPIFRLNGRIDPIRFRVLTDQDYVDLVKPMVAEHLWKEYLETGDCDFAYAVEGLARFRVNLFRNERGHGAVLRIIPSKIMTLDQLGMPHSVRGIAKMRNGLVLVTGPTGSGKSTTMAGIIHEMNLTRPLHFVTIEDPIEFVHKNEMSLVSQREIGPHAKDFKKALRAAVREDPDVILVGELRDLETIELALAAAETGLLVFGTLHTNSASKTIDRVINVFPTERQDGVRGMLGGVLKAVVAQQLLRRSKGGRVAALEVLFGSSALASLIRQGKTHQIPGVISSGSAKGMISMDASLRKLVDGEIVDPLAALEKSLDKDEFRVWLKERGVSVPDSDE